MPMPTRAAMLDALAAGPFDVLVVGGGITGCGIARHAALRGLRTALVEKDDFASGTSSRSSRLVHGGLRYLEHGQLHLVFEASAERRHLLRLAPHLVRPLEFLWPVYGGARVPRWKLRAGLALYDALALFRNVAAHTSLSASAVLAREPRLRADGLRGGATYFDGATDDARLTLANAIGAAEAGAVVVNHCEVRGSRVEGREDRVVEAIDARSGRSVEIRARVVVNATGPWSDTVRRLLAAGDGTRSGGSRPSTLDPRPSLRGSKGVHIAVPRERVGNHGALTVLSPRDGRVMFVLPGGADGEQTIIGTTDTYTTASADEVRATGADVDYLLATANDLFPDARLDRGDVVSAWAGIRPLVAGGEAREGPGAASREHRVEAASGVVTITGGKLTTYRVMASDVLDAVDRELAADGGVRRPRSDRERTRTEPLPGGDVHVEAAGAAAGAATGDTTLARHLVRAYGGRWTAVWAEIRATPDGGRRLAAGLPYTVGELRYGVGHEMAATLADLLVRRTHLAFETRDHGLAAAPLAARAVTDLLGWSAADIVRELESYGREVERLFGIDE